MPQKKDHKGGRPKFPEGEAKREIVRIRFRKAELKAIEAVAKANGLRVSDWVRVTIEAAVKKNGAVIRPLCEA